LNAKTVVVDEIHTSEKQDGVTPLPWER